MTLLIALCTLVSTLLGGLFALRFQDKLHLVLGFSAGAILGVAFFDLLPEAVQLGSAQHSIPAMTSLVALGFALYLVLDRMVALHVHHEGGVHIHARGALGAGSLSLHSFLDGVVIGIAFQVSGALGVIVAVAVLVHDFSDGINTVTLILKNGGNRRSAFRWLTIDAIAPVLGVISTFFFSLSQDALGIILALFSGFFLYIGATDLLPESHHAHPARLTTFMTLLGFGVLYIAIRLANF